MYIKIQLDVSSEVNKNSVVDKISIKLVDKCIGWKYWPQAARVSQKGSSILKCVFPFLFANMYIYTLLQVHILMILSTTMLCCCEISVKDAGRWKK